MATATVVIVCIRFVFVFLRYHGTVRYRGIMVHHMYVQTFYCRIKSYLEYANTLSVFDMRSHSLAFFIHRSGALCRAFLSIYRRSAEVGTSTNSTSCGYIFAIGNHNIRCSNPKHKTTNSSTTSQKIKHNTKYNLA